MADLVVDLYGVHVGTLTGTWRTFDFVSATDAVETFGIDSTILMGVRESAIRQTPGW